jgi:hypothetical protein
MKLHVISLGAGVQSTTMALMAAHGEITPMPDCAIFADTGAEPTDRHAMQPVPTQMVRAVLLRRE